MSRSISNSKRNSNTEPIKANFVESDQFLVQDSNTNALDIKNSAGVSIFKVDTLTPAVTLNAPFTGSLSPMAELTIQSSASTPQLTVANTSSSNFARTAMSAGTSTWTTTVGGQLSSAPNYYTLYSGETKRLIINSGGNATIGDDNYAAGSYKLFVQGDTWTNGTSYILDQCFVRMQAGTINYPVNTWTTFYFENTVSEYDPNNWFNPNVSPSDTANSRITVSRAGTYRLQVNIRLEDGGANTSLGVRILRNGVTICGEFFSLSDSVGRRCITYTDMNKASAANDYYQVQVYHTGLVNKAMFASFEVKRLGD